jgi:DUF4097 and DUF4098 domain-containing protein YvlB
MQTFPTDSKTQIVILNPLGDVRVATGGRDTTSVDLVAHGESGSSAAADATVTHELRDGVHVVSVALPAARSHAKQRRLVDVVITAPDGADVRVATDSEERSFRVFTRRSDCSIELTGAFGDVDVAVPCAQTKAEVVAGALDVWTISGGLDVRRVDGPAKVRTVSGDVSIEESLGALSVAIVSGDVHVVTAHGQVDIASVSGDVVVDVAHGGAACKTTSGAIEVGQACEGAYRFATVSGDARIGVPPGRDVSVDARSMSGTLTSEIDLADDGTDRGADGPLVAITAVSLSGDVSIARVPPVPSDATSRTATPV